MTVLQQGGMREFRVLSWGFETSDWEEKWGQTISDVFGLL